MSQFIQLHLLTAYPPSNLNRDDLGRPKTAIVGGTERLRVSSQSLKRAWRTSDNFQEALSNFQGTRTKRLGSKVFQHLLEKDVPEKKATEWATAIAAVFGKNKKDTPLEIEQLAHVSPEEWSAVMTLAEALAQEDRGPEDSELKLLRETPKAVDIALFGRMLASSPAYNVEAAAQISHAFTVNPVKIEDDFFTAVDDLNTHEEDAGAGHMGDAGFGSGVFYIYCCINKDLLVKNLQGDESLANQTINALLQSAAKVAPTGKQNSFASRAYTPYMPAEKGSQQPRSLSVAFLQAGRGGNPLDEAIKRLESQRDNFENAYGACSDGHKIMDVQKGSGSLAEIIQFVTE
ncbi:MAG: type I-E CRISPR-associated protein Cas7/Cse4/CasC [Pseudomonadales bacterium]|nr:type I-E CRISPR-associated protein Cas7/Cse4/CasC [Pseudomonadales bacterium]